MLEIREIRVRWNALQSSLSTELEPDATLWAFLPFAEHDPESVVEMKNDLS